MKEQEKIIAILKSAPCAATASLQERLAAIEQMVSDEYNVNTLCEALEVAKGTYYNHTLRNKRGETKSAQRRRELFPIIEQIYHESNQTYGAGRITVIMRERGMPIAEGTVARIMHENGLFSIRGGAKALLSSKRNALHIIKTKFCISSTVKPLHIIIAKGFLIHAYGVMIYSPNGLMRYNNGFAVVDDMPLLSQWIKKYHPIGW